MQELSVVVALLVIYNIYITYQLHRIRKQTLKQTGELTTEVLKECMPLMAKVFNKDLNIAVAGVENNIMAYLKHHTSIPIPEDKKENETEISDK